MQTDPQPQQGPSNPQPPNKWLRLGRKILIGALITWCINFVLLKTGWDSWETFSKQADAFSETIMTGALRLSPINLWNSIKSEQKTFTVDNSSPYLPKYIVTGKLSVKDKVLVWLNYYWYTEKGNPFWIGRIILIFALIVGIGAAWENHNSKDGLFGTIVLPFDALIKTLFFLLGLGVATLLLYFLTKLLLAIVGGLVIIFSTVAATGGIVKLIFDEAKGEAADSSKKGIAGVFMPLFIKKRKK